MNERIIDFNKNFAYQRDIAKKSPAYVTGFKDGYHNKPKNAMKFPSGDERKNYKLGYRDGQSGHTKRVDVTVQKVCRSSPA